MKTELDFWNAYDRLNMVGKCDGPGGMEYKRVLAEWKAFGCPSHIEGFIACRANAGPDGVGREIWN